jgi:ABC-2 type transport system permease protein
MADGKVSGVQAASFGRVVRLVLLLRFRLFARALTSRGILGTLAAVLVALALSLGLGAGGFLLFSAVEGIRQSPVWMAFSMGLFFFLLGLFWVIWPVIAAQVDEAYELGRFLTYPVRPGRLYLIQFLTGLLEPSVLFFYPALAGATLGIAQTHPIGWAAPLVLMLVFALMNVACGRCLQNLFLNLMTSRRSGEVLLVGVLLFLGLSAFLPPVDASWLFERLGEFGTSPEDLAVLAQTARALGNTPFGWPAMGLAAAGAGEIRVFVGTLAFMLVTGAIAWLLGLLLLKRFYRGGRGFKLLPSKARVEPGESGGWMGWRLPLVAGFTSAVFFKELRTLVSNPKARLLFAVPFFLLILLKIIGAPQLFLYLWGEAWASVLLALLSLYVLAVLSGQFFANGFGYDEHGIRQTYLSPAPGACWLRGRNLAQGALAALQFLLLGALIHVLMPGTTLKAVALPLCAFPFGLLVMLGVGNLLSARYPRRFHFTLARRDRPVGASFVFTVLVLGTCVLVTLALLGIAGPRPLGLWLALSVLPLLGVAVYKILFPVALGWMRREKERIVEALTR